MSFRASGRRRFDCCRKYHRARGIEQASQAPSREAEHGFPSCRHMTRSVHLFPRCWGCAFCSSSFAPDPHLRGRGLVPGLAHSHQTRSRPISLSGHSEHLAHCAAVVPGREHGKVIGIWALVGHVTEYRIVEWSTDKGHRAVVVVLKLAASRHAHLPATALAQAS